MKLLETQPDKQPEGESKGITIVRGSSVSGSGLKLYLHEAITTVEVNGEEWVRKPTPATQEIEIKSVGLSDKYLLLCYYIHSYLESVKSELDYGPKTTVENFRESAKNEKHCKLVFDHSLSQFNYELSWNQVANGIDLFLKSTRNK